MVRDVHVQVRVAELEQAMLAANISTDPPSDRLTLPNIDPASLLLGGAARQAGAGPQPEGAEPSSQSVQSSDRGSDADAGVEEEEGDSVAEQKLREGGSHRRLCRLSSCHRAPPAAICHIAAVRTELASIYLSVYTSSQCHNESVHILVCCFHQHPCVTSLAHHMY